MPIICERIDSERRPFLTDIMKIGASGLSGILYNPQLIQNSIFFRGSVNGTHIIREAYPTRQQKNPELSFFISRFIPKVLIDHLLCFE